MTNMPRPPAEPLDVMTFIPLYRKYTHRIPPDAKLIGFKQGKQEWRAVFTSEDYETLTLWGNITRSREWLAKKQAENTDPPLPPQTVTPDYVQKGV